MFGSNPCLHTAGTWQFPGHWDRLQLPCDSDKDKRKRMGSSHQWGIFQSLFILFCWAICALLNFGRCPERLSQPSLINDYVQVLFYCGAFLCLICWCRYSTNSISSIHWKLHASLCFPMQTLSFTCWTALWHTVSDDCPTVQSPLRSPHEIKRTCRNKNKLKRERQTFTEGTEPSTHWGQLRLSQSQINKVKRRKELNRITL